ncbi:O-antigen ligase family protein [Curtobacterium sp. 20TX0008]|uniref:O-antigen ligase family protein n=1 Tax=Curtobacterium sp. 20TX0008 TaxID=3022018 RepID=UPI00232EE5DF|nr:O-antigen ligase family protein [Curtobacterium sp. 20TX0008]MDB6427904.1 hypothetical protein [Curtobacterium sp. 20TX0008]
MSFVLGAVCLFLARREGPRTTSRSLLLALLMAAIAVIISSYQSSHFMESLLVGLRLLYVFSIWQWSLRRVLVDTSRVEQIIRAFLLGAAMSSLAAIMQIAFHFDIPGSLVIFGRASGLQGHPNGQGGVLAVALPMALALTFRKNGRASALLYLTLSVVGLILSGSVTGMLGAAVGAVVVVLAGRKKILKIVVLVAAGLCVTLLVQNLDRLFPGAASPLKRLADTTGNGVGDSTLTARLLTDQFAWQRINEHPFGSVGLAAADGVTYDGQTLTHNLLLLSWYQGGPLLVAAVVLASAAALLAAVRYLRMGQWHIGTVLTAGVLAALVFAMTGPVLYDRWFWFPLLVSIAAHRQASTTNRDENRPGFLSE